MSYRITDKQLDTIWSIPLSDLPYKYKSDFDSYTELEKYLMTRVISYKRSIYFQNHYDEYGCVSNRCPWFMYYHSKYSYSSHTYDLYIDYGTSFDTIDYDNKCCDGSFEKFGACSVYTDLHYLLKKTNTNYEIINSPCDKSKQIIRLYDKSTYKNIYVVKDDGDCEINKDDVYNKIITLYCWMINNYDRIKNEMSKFKQ